MKVLGISAFYHDSAACLLVDGRLVAAVQEERFTRLRFDAQLPLQSIRWCLSARGLDIGDVDLVAFYEKPLVKLDRVLDTFIACAPHGNGRFARTMQACLAERLRLPDRLRQTVGWRGPIIYSGHHESHAASAFFPSPFSEAAVLTVDGVGEWTTQAVHAGHGNRLETLLEQQFPHSLGLLYAAFTEYLGFAVLSDEYKVMGLAPYGEPRFVPAILEHIIDIKEDGSFRLDLRAFRFVYGEESANHERFAEIFGVGPRAPSDPLGPAHLDLARSIQAVCEDVMLRQARHAAKITGARDLCLAGGVSLNCVANGRILREGPFDRVWIQPAAGDAGGCIGAAYAAYHLHSGLPRVPTEPDGMSGALLGPEYTEEAIESALADAGLHGERYEAGALVVATAALLASGKVVGWFQGPLEFGPRALGARSILADPRLASMQQQVNEKIKFRDSFRPFAPAVPGEDASAWFDTLSVERPSPYMLLVANVRGEHLIASDTARVGLARLGDARSTIPAVTHVDGSARVQTVERATHPLFHGLLRAFAAATGCPVLLNTSFNLNGEPIVCSPTDACRTFVAGGLDALVIGPCIVTRPDVVPQPRPPVLPSPAPASVRELRWFAAQLTFALSMLMLVGALRGARPLFAVIIGVLVVASLAVPRALGPVARPWMRVARRASELGSGSLLRIVHVVFVIPTACLRRRPAWLALPDRAASTHWIPVQRGRPSRYRHMY